MLYTFGSCSLDTKRREFLTAEGTVPLRPKVFDLLTFLIENRDRVVSKQEFFEQLWPDVHVGDAALNTCIKAARQAVGDSGRSQAVIRTWHGHGYRFVAAVEERRSEASSATAVSLAEDEEASKAPRREDASVQAPPLPERRDSQPPSAAPYESFFSGKEHKQVTALHCVLCDAPDLAAKLGAEAMDETMERFMAIANNAAQSYGGTVTQWLGDGFVALFGAPQAAEDHARRGVAASLELLARLASDLSAVAVSIGLHTGPVVVGATEIDPGRIYTAAGITTETAKALQGIAPPRTVVVSEETLGIVHSEVKSEPFLHNLSALESLSPAFIVRDLVTRHSGVPRHSGRMLSRFVGRDRELATLHDRLEYLWESSGQVVSISGEPGIGKSRLVEEFERSIAGKNVHLFRANCLSYGGASPYLPVRGLLRQISGMKSSDPPDVALRKLDACLGKAGLVSPTVRALFGQLLDLPVEWPNLERLSPAEHRVLLFDHLYTIVARGCAERPYVIVVEDLHWIDATSEAWLSGLVMRLAGLRLLLLVTYRPGYQAPWLPQSSATQFALTSLRSEVSNTLVRSIPTATPLSETDVRQIVDKAQGNPFFLEELAWTLGSGRYDRLGIPETVQTVLAARIDRLAHPDKRLLQIASVIGPEAPLPILSAIDGLTDEERRHCLLRLQEAEFLYERQAVPQRVFAFKHVVTQEVAYKSLVARTRQTIHRRIADVLESEFRALIRGRPELLAHHLTESDQLQRAADSWLEAGRRASERSANAEATAHLSRGLELLERLPESPDRRQREIAFQLALGVPLLSTKGPGSSETEQAYRRAGELCRACGDRLNLFFATWGLWRFNSANSNMPEARDLAGRLLDLAQEKGDPTLLLQAHHAHWTTLYNHGELHTALEHIERGLALYNPEEHGNQAFLVAGHDPCVCAHVTAAQILWITGYPDQALSRTDFAQSLAKELGNPSSVAIAMNHALRLCVAFRDTESAGRWQKALRALASQYGFPGHINCCELVQVWSDAREQDGSEGIAEMRHLLTARPDLAGLEGPLALSFLLEACLSADRAAEGLDLLAVVNDKIDRSGLSVWNAEFDRLRGEFLLSLSADNEAEAEEHFSSAISLSRRLKAKSLELRSATCLARLWNRQGKRSKARELLEPIYSWFAEGHDTRDLIDAKLLLDTLSR